MKLYYKIANKCSFKYNIDINLLRRVSINVILNFISKITGEMSFDITYINDDANSYAKINGRNTNKVFTLYFLDYRKIGLDFDNYKFVFECDIEPDYSILALSKCQTDLGDKVICEEYLSHEAIFRVLTPQKDFLLRVPYDNDEQIDIGIFAHIYSSSYVETLLEIYLQHFNVESTTKQIYPISLEVKSHMIDDILEQLKIEGDALTYIKLGQEIDGIYVNLVSDVNKNLEGALIFKGDLGIISSLNINNYKKWLITRYDNLKEREVRLVRKRK